MRLFIISLVLCIMLPITMVAQEDLCGTIPTQSDMEWIRQLKTSADARTSAILKQVIKVQFWWVKDNSCHGDVSQRVMSNYYGQVMELLNSKYNPLNIYFVYNGPVVSVCNTSYYNGNDTGLRANHYIQDAFNIYVTQINDSNARHFAPLGGEYAHLLTPGINLTLHEIGHSFMLLHTFGSVPDGPTDELVSRTIDLNGNGIKDCAEKGDGFCDTPADPYCKACPGRTTKDLVDRNTCTYKGTVRDSRNELYNPIIKNFMSYYYTSCSNDPDFNYTQEQKNHIINVGLPTKNGVRNEVSTNSQLCSFDHAFIQRDGCTFTIKGAIGTCGGAVSNIVWSKSSNLNYLGGQGTNNYRVMGKTSSGTGWVEAAFTNAYGKTITAHKLYVDLNNLPDAKPQFAVGNLTGPGSLQPGQNGLYSGPSASNTDSYSWAIPSGWRIIAGQTSTSARLEAGGAVGLKVIELRAHNECGYNYKYTYTEVTSSGGGGGGGGGGGDPCLATLAVAPNPSSGNPAVFVIKPPTPCEASAKSVNARMESNSGRIEQVSIFTSSGIMVYQNSAITSESINLDDIHLTQGLYHVQVIYDGKMLQQKLIIE